jgi:hypothetical protein
MLITATGTHRPRVAVARIPLYRRAIMVAP